MCQELLVTYVSGSDKNFFWRARRDSNPRPLAPQASALSTELRAHSGQNSTQTEGRAYFTLSITTFSPDALVKINWSELAKLNLGLGFSKRNCGTSMSS